MYEKKNVFNKLNNYDYSNYDGIRYYILTDEVPDDLNDRQKKAFEKKFNEDFDVDEDGNIYFVPLKLLVVKDNEKQMRLRELYDDPVESLGKGINAFYASVVDKYLNISRKETEEFLKNQPVYQMTTDTVKRVQKPMVANFPNEKWALDLIDMNQYVKQNNQFRYILSGIDYFSRKCFAIKLKKKDVLSTTKALKKIISEQADGVYPISIITDNGTEFNLDEFCEEHHIKLMKTMSHSPTQNGLIENLNGTIRRLIRQNFVKINKLNWIDYLDIIVDNINNKKHSVTGYAPDKLWTPTTSKIRKVKKSNSLEQSTQQIQNIVLDKSISKAEKAIEALRKQTFKKNDYVRISTFALSSNIRKAYKSGNQKNIVVKFTPKIYKIYHIIYPNNKMFQLEKYQVADEFDNPILEEMKINNPNKDRKIKSFFATELLKVNPETMTNISNADAKKLNKIAINTEDVSDDDYGEVVDNNNVNDNVVEEVIEKPKKKTKEVLPSEKPKRTPKKRVIMDL